eukprot:TRINITY_DN9719_c0_g1_i2.p2 TRINITY_DN9719_c0_g1~~TRINITY_DN9719_c0_g1_i2.p2  ORF type:complete len:108 (-),score=8.57 TRINITY_DN9719_c0_g1_i2:42-365(-)
MQADGRLVTGSLPTPSDLASPSLPHVPLSSSSSMAHSSRVKGPRYDDRSKTAWFLVQFNLWAQDECWSEAQLCKQIFLLLRRGDCFLHPLSNSGLHMKRCFRSGVLF